MPVTITDAVPADAGEIIAVQHLAFAEQGELYSTCGIPPLVETPEDLRADFGKSVVLKAVDGGRIVGSVRGRVQGSGACFVARLSVLPEVQGRGIGRALMREIEARFPNAPRFELVTGERSEKSLHLYGKLGYAPVRTEKVSETITLVFMEKHVGAEKAGRPGAPEGGSP